MKLKPGFEATYKERHDHLFPELRALLLSCGVLDYSIFLDRDSLTLFGYQLLADDYDESTVSDHPVMRKWWAYMADIMEVNADDSPVVGELVEVFQL